MLETVRIRRAGYPIRVDYASFVQQYRILLPRGRESARDDLERFINEHPLIEPGSVQFGKTKVCIQSSNAAAISVERRRSDLHARKHQTSSRQSAVSRRANRLLLEVDERPTFAGIEYSCCTLRSCKIGCAP